MLPEVPVTGRRSPAMFCKRFFTMCSPCHALPKQETILIYFRANSKHKQRGASCIRAQHAPKLGSFPWARFNWKRMNGPLCISFFISSLAPSKMVEGTSPSLHMHNSEKTVNDLPRAKIALHQWTKASASCPHTNWRTRERRMRKSQCPKLWGMRGQPSQNFGAIDTVIWMQILPNSVVPSPPSAKRWGGKIQLVPNPIESAESKPFTKRAHSAHECGASSGSNGFYWVPLLIAEKCSLLPQYTVSHCNKDASLRSLDTISHCVAFLYLYCATNFQNHRNAAASFNCHSGKFQSVFLRQNRGCILKVLASYAFLCRCIEVYPWHSQKTLAHPFYVLKNCGSAPLFPALSNFRQLPRGTYNIASWIQ